MRVVLPHIKKGRLNLKEFTGLLIFGGGSRQTLLLLVLKQIVFVQLQLL